MAIEEATSVEKIVLPVLIPDPISDQRVKVGEAWIESNHGVAVIKFDEGPGGDLAKYLIGKGSISNLSLIVHPELYEEKEEGENVV